MGTRAVPSDLHAASVARALSNAAAHPEAARLALLARRDHAALAEARARDALLCAGVAPPPLAGATLGVKACFDVAGWVTHAGSRVLAGEPPARATRPSCRRCAMPARRCWRKTT